MAAKKSTKAPKTIDPAYAVPVMDLMSKFQKWQKELFERFPPPMTSTGASAKSGLPTINAKGQWVIYTVDGIRCYWKIKKSTTALWIELSCLETAAAYHAAPEGVASASYDPTIQYAKKGGKKKKKKKAAA